MRFNTNRRRFRRKGDAGFTLLELLVVLAILGLLAALVGPRVLQYLGGAKSEAAKIQLTNIEAGLDLYKFDVGTYPARLQDLIKPPADAQKWNGPYVKKAEGIVDPWGEQYGYRFPGQHAEYDLFSLGADRAEGGEGENRDLRSW